jgi:hypothetical protein
MLLSAPLRRRLVSLAAALAASVWLVMAEPAAALPWMLTPTPAPGPDASWLTGTSAHSAVDAWAVGNWVPRDLPDQPLALHWDGTAWTESAMPHAPDGANLEGVAVVPGTSDAWAVGERFGVPSLALIERWHAGHWATVPSPWVAAQLFDVTALRRRVAFAGGISQTGRPLVLRFDGRSWTKMIGPGQLARSGVVAAVAARSRDDVWAVGHRWTGGVAYPLILHFDGKRWTRIPDAAARPGFLRAVTVVPGTDEAWAVGSNSDPWKTVIMHFDGRSWSRVRHPEPGGIAGGELRGVTAAGPNKAWAVGVSASAATLIWNGETWRETVTPRADGAGLNAIARVPRSIETFAVGFRLGSTYAIMQR